MVLVEMLIVVVVMVVVMRLCRSESTRVMIAALNFFLGIENKMHEVSDSSSSSGSSCNGTTVVG